MRAPEIRERLIWMACGILAVAWVLAAAANFWLQDFWVGMPQQEQLVAAYTPLILASILILTNLVVGWLLYTVGLGEIRKQADTERKVRQSLEAVYRGTLQTLTMALDERDGETFGHSQRVMGYSLAIGQRLCLTPHERQTLAWGALLHDLGKIGIRDAILLKPGPLTEAERLEMMQHVQIGCRMVGNVPFLTRTAALIRHHHERFDGTGYPDGLRGQEIPLLARIFSVADAYDAMTTPRPYRPVPLTAEEALAVIHKGAGSQFCPAMAEIFTNLPMEQLEAIRSGSLTPVEDLGPLVWTDETAELGNDYYRDSLSGAQNRTAWEAKRALMARMKGRELGTLVFLDVNRFKQVNDNHGHMTGDHVLADLGARLLRVTPEVYRYGGDEFLLWFPQDGWSEEVLRQIERKLRIFESAWTHLEQGPTVSFGYQTATAATQSLEDLLTQADQQMYAVKHQRRSAG